MLSFDIIEDMIIAIALAVTTAWNVQLISWLWAAIF